MSRKIRAIVFDFDGLILDTETAEVEGWRKIFAQHGQEFPDEVWINAIGRGADQIAETPVHFLERLIGRALDHGEINEARRRLSRELIDQKDALPGVREAIGEARELGLGLAVASSSHHHWVDGFLDRLGLLSSFDAVLCADDVARAKPHPDLYQAAMDALGHAPEAGIALEDSPMGIRAAKAAGLFCVAVPNELTKLLPLDGADMSVPSLAETSVQCLITAAALR
jgi:HAD superfamily hydrolase (TIGR01509 family)